MSESHVSPLAPTRPAIATRSRSLLHRFLPIIPRRSHQGSIYREQLAQVAKTTDRAFAVVLSVEWLVGIGLALGVSPLAWEGRHYTIHQHVVAAVLLGGVIALPAALSAWFRAGQWWTRHMVATAQTLMAALFIHFTQGRIETHFMIFGSLAFLAFYRDWTVLLNATVVVFVDHLLRGWLFPLSVYGVQSASIWRSVEHVGWVFFEDIFLLYAISRGNFIQAKVASTKLAEMGQYIPKEKLGSGGMGEVFLAEHRLLKRPCAIKTLHREVANNLTLLARFEREVRATAKLRHPNTVEIYDYGHLENGIFYYVMEYLPGLTLQKWLDRHGPFPPARVVHVLRQVCGALAEAHGYGLIHRDITPENILLCDLGGQQDVAKVLDFGLVRHTNPESTRLSLPGAILGTPDYMAPEQVKGQEIDQRGDLFSLGVVAYLLLTGRKPFEGDNPLAVMYARISAGAEPPSVHRPEVPADLEGVVLRCLSREKEDRFPTARALERAFSQCECAGEWGVDEATLCWEQEAAQAANELATAAKTTQITSPEQSVVDEED